MMKKTTRFLGSLLAGLLLLSAAPLAVTAVEPAASQTAEAMPSVLPDGASVDLSRVWVDWDVAGVDGAAIENGYNKVTKKDSTAWCHNDLSTTSWKGASGLMFQVDASEAQGNVDFILELLVPSSRPKDASNGLSWIQFRTAPTIWSGAINGPAQVGNTSVAYYYQDGQWKDFSVAYPSYYLGTGAKQSGWYYVPFESLWYSGASAQGYDVSSTGFKNFVEFMSHYQDQRVGKCSVRSNAVGLKIGDIHFVYSYSEAVACDKTGSVSLGAQIANQESHGKGSANNGAITVSGMTNNSGTADGSRVWLKFQQGNIDLSAASGLRFYVDTTAMDASAKVQLRLRILTPFGVDTIKDVYAANAGGYASFNGGWMQYVCRANNSVAYYYDATGAAKVLTVSSDVSTNNGGDLFEALPSGYKGYVYVPFDSFWLSCGSYSNLTCVLPFADVAATYPLYQLALCGVVSGTESDSVTYSDFELVYKDTAITGASVSLTNDLNINFYADVQEGATDACMNYIIGSKNITVNGVKQENGSYRFVCEGLLPQTAVDTVYATLSATVKGATVTQQVKYSVRDYCENMLKREDTSAELKTLLVDLLYYAEAAQNYAGYKTDDLATKNLTEAQKALRSADSTAAITATANKTGTPNEQYSWVSAGLRLENTMAVRFKFKAASIEGVTVAVSINGRTVTFDEFAGENGVYTLVFNNIGAAEYDSEITAVIRVNGEQVGEALTYSVAAYIGEAAKTAESANLKDLLRAAYSYGSSAKAYAK